MQTTMQIFIEFLEQYQGCQIQANQIIRLAKKSLIVEKIQIKNAFDNGEKSEFFGGIDYYNKTYKQKKCKLK